MRKIVSTLMAFLVAIAVSAQGLTREQMQDSIITIMGNYSYDKIIQSIQKTNANLGNVSEVKLDCAAEKVLGMNEWKRNSISQHLQTLSDSELQETFVYAKLSSRMSSPEYASAIAGDLTTLFMKNMTPFLTMLLSGKGEDYKPDTKAEKFIINDAEVDAYVNKIMENTTESKKLVSNLVESMAKEKGLDAKYAKMVDGFVQSLVDVSVERSKKSLLTFYTKQELKQMSDFLSSEKGKALTAIFDSQISKAQEMADKLAATNWTQVVSEVTDAEVAMHAQKYLSFFPIAYPLSREKGTLTINGGQYTGEIWNGQANGIGKLVDAKGNTYTGDFLANQKDGYGVMVTAKGKESTGYWKKDKFLGEQPKDTDYGYQRKDDIFYEEGIFKHGVLCGKGSRSIERTATINGEFEEGRMTNGTLSYTANGGRIVGKGAFDIMMSGTGVLQVTANDVTVERTGNFINGNLNGYGTLIRKEKSGNAEKSWGLFVDDHLAGKCMLIVQGTFKDGETYTSRYSGYYYNGKNGEGADTIVGSRGYRRIRVGTFKNGRLVNGTQILPNDSSVYEGELKDGEYNGKGKLTFPNRSYEGEFKDGDFHGEGTLIFVDGTKIAGSWVKGRLNGRGTITMSDGKSLEGTFISGRCSDGVLRDKKGTVLRTGVLYSNR